jgi:hypothetical protein
MRSLEAPPGPGLNQEQNSSPDDAYAGFMELIAQKRSQAQEQPKRRDQPKETNTAETPGGEHD